MRTSWRGMGRTESDYNNDECHSNFVFAGKFRCRAVFDHENLSELQ